MRRVGLAVALVMALSTSANASIIYNFQALTPSGSNFRWTFLAQLSQNEKIDTVTPGASAPAFGTIFDFPGAISANSTPLVAGLALASTGIAGAQLSVITSPGAGPVNNVPDPMTTNIPYVGWYGGEQRLVKCVPDPTGRIAIARRQTHSHRFCSGSCAIGRFPSRRATRCWRSWNVHSIRCGRTRIK